VNTRESWDVSDVGVIWPPGWELVLRQSPASKGRGQGS
jgi:hypothetical protein